MLKGILIFGALTLATNAFAINLFQTGCTPAMVTVSHKIADDAQKNYDNGISPRSDLALALINDFNTMYCAGQIKKDKACSEMRFYAAADETLLRAQYSQGYTSMDKMLNGIQLYNDLVIACHVPKTPPTANH